MKYLLLLFILLFAGSGVQADTIDYVTVSYKGKPVSASVMTQKLLVLKAADISRSDALSISYNRDMPCFNCVSVVAVIPHNKPAQKKNAVAYGFGSGTGSNTSFPASLLRFYDNPEGNHSFDIYYYEEGLQANTEPGFILSIRLE